MTLALALGIFSGVLGLVTWFIKRKRSPTLDEQKFDVRRNYNDNFQNVYRLRQEGNHREADAMLDRMSLAALPGVPHDSVGTIHQADPDWKRLGDHPPKGDANSPK